MYPRSYVYRILGLSDMRCQNEVRAVGDGFWEAGPSGKLPEDCGVQYCGLFRRASSYVAPRKRLSPGRLRLGTQGRKSRNKEAISLINDHFPALTFGSEVCVGIFYALAASPMTHRLCHRPCQLILCARRLRSGTSRGILMDSR